MAFNRTDTKQRAFVPVDVCNPQGTWIEEPQYNRHRTVKGVRMGNWQEDQSLTDSMLAIDHTIQKRPTPKPVDHDKRGKKIGQVPHLQGSHFLVNSKMDPTNYFQTTSELSYAGEQPKPVATGDRKKKLHRDIIREAEQALRDIPGPTSGWETETSRLSTHLPPKYAAAPDPRVGADAFLYDQPISIYSDLKGVAVGMTAKTSKNPFGKNASLTTPLGQFNRGTTPMC